MPEHQNVENSDLASKNQVHLKFFEREEFGQSQYKSNWHEEYLDWICDFILILHHEK